MNTQDALYGLTMDFSGASRLADENHFFAFNNALRILFTVLQAVFPDCRVDFYRKSSSRRGMFRRQEISYALMASHQLSSNGDNSNSVAEALYTSEDSEFVARVYDHADIQVIVCADPIYFRFEKRA